MSLELNVTAGDFELVAEQIAYKGDANARVRVYEDDWYMYDLILMPETQPFQRDHALCVVRFDKQTGVNPDENLSLRRAWLWYDYTWLGRDRPDVKEVSMVLSRIAKELEDFRDFKLNKAIETTHYQSWKVVALLKGLGFSFDRSEEGDCFTSDNLVECIYDGWTPSKDGSRLVSYEQLSDETSAHYGRYYITVYRFTASGGYDNVLVWSSSSSACGELFGPIALSSYSDWERFAKADTQIMWDHYLRYHGIRL